jgi:Secretion system C-terminal sorting domain
MKTGFIFLFLFLSFFLCGQELISEDFSSGIFPPDGWGISRQHENWMLSERNSTGKEAPEAQLYFTPIFTDTTRLLSPYFVPMANKDVRVEFNQTLDHKNSNYQIGLSYLSEGEWIDVWEESPDSSCSNRWKSFLVPAIELPDSTRFSWYFKGASYNMYAWFLDDIRIYHPYEVDISATQISLNNKQFSPGDSIKIETKMMNVGQQEHVGCGFKIQIELDEDIVFVSENMTEFFGNTSFEFNTNILTPLLQNKNYDVKLIVSAAPGDDFTANDTITTTFNTFGQERLSVLLELATGTWCGVCPGASIGIQELIDSGKMVSPIAYHISDNYTNESSIDRINYYFVPAYPTVYFDGGHKYVGGHQFLSKFADYLPIYQKQINVKSPGSLALYGQEINNRYEISVEVELFAKIRTGDLKLFLVLNESHIPEIWGPLNEVNHVERLILPSIDGLEVEPDEGRYVYNLGFDLDLDWKKENCELIAFLQDEKTFEVFQAVGLNLENLKPVSIAKDKSGQIIVFPNPAEQSINIDLRLLHGAIEMEIVNPIGKVLNRVNLEGQKSHTIKLIDFGGKELESGLYILVFKNDQDVFTKRVIKK